MLSAGLFALLAVLSIWSERPALLLLLALVALAVWPLFPGPQRR